VGRLFLLFTLLPIVELFVLIRIGRVIGPWYTIFFVIAMGVLGAWLAKTQGRRVITEWQMALAQGRVPNEGVLSGLLVLLGGVLLITPGVISDVFGLVLLVPPTRKLVAGVARTWLERQMSLGAVQIHGVGTPFGSPSAGTPPGGSPRGTRFDPRFGQVIDTKGENVE
jgi:UPF0716 protein FxsA